MTTPRSPLSLTLVRAAATLALALLGACGEGPELVLPYDPAPAAAQMPEVRDHLRAGRPELALDALDRLAAEGVLPEGAMHYRALALGDLGRTAEAQAAWRAELLEHPGNGHAHAFLAQLLIEAGRLDEAAEHLDAARRHAPGFALGVLLRGRLALLRDEDETAQRAFRDYLMLDAYGPQAAQAHHGLAQIAARRGPAGADEARRQEQLGRELDELHGYLRSYEARLRDRPDDALAAYGAAAAFLNLYMHRGGDPALLARAEPALRHVLALQPGHAKALDNMGFVRAEQRRFDEALEYFVRAVEADPSYLPARINGGRLLVQRGRYAEGIAQLEAALSLAEDDPAALERTRALLARSYAESPDAATRRLAIPHLRVLLEADPSDPYGLRVQVEALEAEAKADVEAEAEADADATGDSEGGPGSPPDGPP